MIGIAILIIGIYRKSTVMIWVGGIWTSINVIYWIRMANAPTSASVMPKAG